MNSILYFLAACAGIALMGWIVSKITGSSAWYIEDWTFEPGEVVLFRDDAADTYLIPELGQALIMSFARPRRGFVVVTSQRIIIGTRPLFGTKRMVQYVLYVGVSPDGSSARLDGGLLTRGYQTIVLLPGGIQPHPDDSKPHVDLTPLSSEPSSTNLQTIRIFTDLAASFRLP